MCTTRLQGGGGSVGISWWGTFFFLFVNCIYKNRINQETYIKVLENCLEPSVFMLQMNNENWIYQQDNDPAHTANSVKQYFELKRINVLPWPARSPYLNPIENILGNSRSQNDKLQRYKH